MAWRNWWLLPELVAQFCNPSYWEARTWDGLRAPGLETATFSEFGSAPWAFRGLLRCGGAAFRRPRSCFNSWCGRCDKSPTQPDHVLNIVHSYEIKNPKKYFFEIWHEKKKDGIFFPFLFPDTGHSFSQKQQVTQNHTARKNNLLKGPGISNIHNTL
jgi:hypothetical protein